ncbi:MAG: cupin domain-containing protein [Planctomycetaceae bacterium]|nr:cupin domain-containing protein [Planctomycetaceae bacterium]
MDIVNLSTTISFTTKDGSSIRELLSHRNSGIRNQSLAEATVPPGVTTLAHYHPCSEEIYYILSGQGKMHLGEAVQEVGPGDAIAIPPGVVHWIENSKDLDLVFLCCCAPGYEHSDTVIVDNSKR